MLDKYIVDLTNPNDLIDEKFELIDESFEVFKSLYNTNYGSINEDGNLIDIHTGGWSENEELISQLKRTPWWMKHFVMYREGGHYYFEKKKHTGNENWEIIKKKDNG